MSSFDSALDVMDNDDDSNSHHYRTTKEKFYAIHEDIAKLISDEQVAAATNGTSIVNAITESKARVLKLLKEPNGRRYFSSNIESSEVFLRSHRESKANLVILYADLVGSTHMSTVLDLRDLAAYIADIYARNDYYGRKKSWLYTKVCWGCGNSLFSYN